MEPLISSHWQGIQDKHLFYSHKTIAHSQEIWEKRMPGSKGILFGIYVKNFAK